MKYSVEFGEQLMHLALSGSDWCLLDCQIIPEILMVLIYGKFNGVGGWGCDFLFKIFVVPLQTYLL